MQTPKPTPPAAPAAAPRYVKPDVRAQGAFATRTLDSYIGSIPEFFAVVDVSDVNIVWGE